MHQRQTRFCTSPTKKLNAHCQTSQRRRMRAKTIREDTGFVHLENRTTEAPGRECRTPARDQEMRTSVPATDRKELKLSRPNPAGGRRLDLGHCQNVTRVDNLISATTQTVHMCPVFVRMLLRRSSYSRHQQHHSFLTRRSSLLPLVVCLCLFCPNTVTIRCTAKSTRSTENWLIRQCALFQRCHVLIDNHPFIMIF